MADAYNVQFSENGDEVTVEVDATSFSFPDHEDPHGFIIFRDDDGRCVYYIESYKVEHIAPHFGEETRVTEIGRVENATLGGL